MANVDIRASLVRQIRDTQAGHPWFGGNRAELLAGLTAAQAASHPVEGAHSVWELVLHMTAWTREVTRRLGGKAPGEPEEGDWPPVTVTSPAAWESAKDALADAHAGLMRTIAALPDARWTASIGQAGGGSDIDVAGTLVGLAQHDAYHSGQVGLLRKALP